MGLYNSFKSLLQSLSVFGEYNASRAALQDGEEVPVQMDEYGNVRACASRFPRVAHVTSLLLTSSYNNPTAYPIPSGTRVIVAYVTYITNAAGNGGYPRFRPEWGNGTESGCQDIVVSSPAPPYTNGVAARSTYFDEFNGPDPGAGNTTVKYRLAFDVLGGETTFLLKVKESGNTTNPGTISIAFTAKS